MAERKNICKYIDIPLQHISDRILRSMKRGANKADTLALIKRFRAELPDAAIRTAFIVGYPGETRAEFDELLEFVAEAKFDRVGVFTYSHEEDTHAYHYADTVPEDVKRARAAKLMEVQAEIALSNNQHYIGQTHKVLIDRLEGEYYVGRTQYDSPEVDNEVLLKARGGKLQIGSFCMAKINSADTYDLMATVVK
jgi:ribosomal protein S12 methylthiotransferase